MKLLLPVLLLLSACSSQAKLPPLRTVPYVDLPKYMGAWYVIGTIPWFVEKNNVGTMDIYELRPDGKIATTYVYHKKSLDAPRKEMKLVGTVKNKTTNSEWAMQFLWPFQAPFLIIGLSEDYQTTIVGHPSRNLIWIMSRKPTMSEKDYDRALSDAAKQGYDTSRIVKVPQRTL